ncbi:lipoprotein [Myxococcus stipitatus DSM 14675]|uniref:Lipoprotein n=2 Tax=Myxococcus stipitatus TaxID=83455 RepID=L7U503_MYXSD|nr:lipoprotein [Myxococcus stipitatus DSM 14675]
MWMASAVALSACGGAEQDTAPVQAPGVEKAEDADERVAERRIIVYLTGNQSLYALKDGQSVLVAERSGAPAVSPDGRDVVFAKLPDSWTQGDPVTRADLHVYSLRTGKLSRLTSGHDDQTPSWSPDGKSILFQSKARSGVSSFWRVNPNGKGLKQLTNVSSPQSPSLSVVPTPMGGTGVEWGPQERRIIVYLTAQPSGSAVQVVSFDRNLDVTNAYSLGEGTSPRWTEQGTIVFLREVRGQLTEVEVSVDD